MESITIIGLGLIGTSIGLALKQAKVDLEIVGHDSEPEVSHAARKRGAVDKIEWNLPHAVEKSRVVIVATPVVAIEGLFKVLADVLPDGCIVTDTGSTKRQVMEWAGQILPSRVSFVGGHPMAGKDTSGPEAADADLFKGRAYCIVPSVNASETAVASIANMAQTIGAEPFFVDADEHDGLTAAVSHLPLVLSTALVRTTALKPSWKEMSRVAASGFRDVSRLASGNPTMQASICCTNRDNLVRWIDAFSAELKILRDDITGNDEALLAKFKEAKTARDRWLSGEDNRPPAVEFPTFKETMGQTLLGDRLFRPRGQQERRS